MATPGTRQLLLDINNLPTGTVSFSSSNWTGTLDPARIPLAIVDGKPINPSYIGATTPVTKGTFGLLTINGLITATGGISCGSADDGGIDGSGMLYGNGSLLSSLLTSSLVGLVDISNGGTNAATAAAARANLGAETSANKGANNGYAPLDSTARVPLANLPASVAGSLHYQGVWNASTNSPTITSGTATSPQGIGSYYVVSVSGTTTVDGVSVWTAGDWIVFDGTKWDKLDGAANPVSSVAGRTGTIVLTTADIGGITGYALLASAPTFTGDLTAPHFLGSGLYLTEVAPYHKISVAATVTPTGFTSTTSGANTDTAGGFTGTAAGGAGGAVAHVNFGTAYVSAPKSISINGYDNTAATPVLAAAANILGGAFDIMTGSLTATHSYTFTYLVSPQP